MARILCVEDSKEFQVFLSSVLRAHTLVHVGTANEALRAVESGKALFDLVLLDVSLPDGNGMKILPKIKEMFEDKPVPFIVISSDTDVLTKVAAFGVGADDYISKPPNSIELAARVEAKLRWVNSISSHQPILSLGNLYLDIERMTVEIANEGQGKKSVDLTPIEFKLLKLLIGRPEQVFSRDAIIERIWGTGKYITPRTVDAHISHLRSKVSESNVQIETVLSTGYKVSKLNSPSN